MAQWTNLWQIKKFVNQTRLYIADGKTEGLHLHCGSAGSYGRQASSRADEIWVWFEILKFAVD